MFADRQTRQRRLLLSCLLALALPAGAEAVCPCWTTEELRAAVALLPEDPSGEDDAIVGSCDVSVSPFSPRLSARLVFQNQIGDRFEGGIVEFNLAVGNQRCLAFDDGLGLALTPIEFVGLDAEEASTCALGVSEVCQDLLLLLPEPSPTLLQGAGVCMLGLMARARRSEPPFGGGGEDAAAPGTERADRGCARP